MIRRLAALEEPFDLWFKEKLLELLGYDLDGPSPRPEPELVFAYAPRHSLRGSSRSGVEEQTVIPNAYLEHISSNAPEQGVEE